MTKQEEINILKGAKKLLEEHTVYGYTAVIESLVLERINDVIASLESK